MQVYTVYCMFKLYKFKLLYCLYQVYTEPEKSLHVTFNYKALELFLSISKALTQEETLFSFQVVILKDYKLTLVMSQFKHFNVVDQLCKNSHSFYPGY